MWLGIWCPILEKLHGTGVGGAEDGTLSTGCFVGVLAGSAADGQGTTAALTDLGHRLSFVLSVERT